jgi:hypothetical protein
MDELTPQCPRIIHTLLPVRLVVSKVDRRQTRLYRSHAAADDHGYMPGTAEERVSQVWELTRETWAFVRGSDAEQRLQRDAAVFIRRKR